jgi:glycerol-3-phosphate cytidylyltransferase
MCLKTNKIITYGTFDLFHIGHLRLLQRVKNLGNHLTVAVSTDDFNAIKGKKTLISYDQRREIVENIKCVDQVIPETCWEQKEEDIKNFDIDIFAMGNDWEGKFDFLRNHCEVVYLPRTDDISSTEIKQQMDAFLKEHSIEL